MLILDIFAAHALTKEGKIQAELTHNGGCDQKDSPSFNVSLMIGSSDLRNNRSCIDLQLKNGR